MSDTFVTSRSFKQIKTSIERSDPFCSACASDRQVLEARCIRIYFLTVYDYFGFLRFADKKRRRAEGATAQEEKRNVQRDSGIFFVSIRGKTWFERVEGIVEKRETLATSHYVHSERRASGEQQPARIAKK